MLTKIYDLHCHSTASDGVLSPSEVVQRAYEHGVQVLAITDHDTISGLSEAKTQAKKLGMQFINGVEISTSWENKGIHIVGLGFDENSTELTALLTRQAELRYQRALTISEKLAKVGVPNAFEGAKTFASGEVTRAHYARYLVQIGKVANESQAFKRYLGQGKSCFVKSEWTDIPSAINVIKQAGGVSIIAHPLRYTMTSRWVKRLIADFKSWGGQGMEISNCGQTPDQRQLLAKWANEHQLFGSVGSDFHFPCSWVELGKSLWLPENVMPVWSILNID
ncbi:RNase RNM [Mannheimia massilioguelmaensis]|uniref:RNase RNM n=1 Tax=Mannheimia massilioguelmaensis TaxID=1604354 RepID=UPI0005C99AC9|nr:PHP domain-containing protein [Mannheimia massilioguelmaensis]